MLLALNIFTVVFPHVLVAAQYGGFRVPREGFEFRPPERFDVQCTARRHHNGGSQQRGKVGLERILLQTQVRKELAVLGTGGGGMGGKAVA